MEPAVSPGNDVQTSHPSEADIELVGRSKLIQTIQTEPHVELFMNLSQ